MAEWTICNECGADIRGKSPVYTCQRNVHDRRKFFCTIVCLNLHTDRCIAKEKRASR